jgi:hypothetical protein
MQLNISNAHSHESTPSYIPSPASVPVSSVSTLVETGTTETRMMLLGELLRRRSLLLLEESLRRRGLLLLEEAVGVGVALRLAPLSL